VCGRELESGPDFQSARHEPANFHLSPIFADNAFLFTKGSG